MDAVRVALLREVLAGTEWLRSTRAFAGTLRAAAVRSPGGLLLVGTARYEPWHLAAHLDDEAAWSGLPGLSPTLVRFRVPDGAPAHLAVDVTRLAAAGRGETVLVVAPDLPGPALLERVCDARRAGATVLALEAAAAGPGAGELHGLAHDALTVRVGTAPGEWGGAAPGEGLGTAPGEGLGTAPGEWGGTAPGESAIGMELAQHLVSAAAGEGPSGSRRRRFRDRIARIARIADGLTDPAPRW